MRSSPSPQGRRVSGGSAAWRSHPSQVLLHGELVGAQEQYVDVGVCAALSSQMQVDGTSGAVHTLIIPVPASATGRRRAGTDNEVTAREGSAYCRWMEVTFTKVDNKRYTVAIERQLGPPLVPRFGPGFDVRMPHDIAHFLVEECFGIELGVWGRLAAGGGGIFFPAPEDNSLRYQRRAQRMGHLGRVDMQRSERLVGITVEAWEQGIDLAKHVPRPGLDEVGQRALEGAVRRLSEVAERWDALPRGGSLTLEWPRRLAFDGSKAYRGRRTTKPTPHPARRRTHNQRRARRSRLAW